MLSQDAKQTVPPDPQLRLRLMLEQEMQLPGAQARLAHPQLPHELGDLPILMATAIRRPIALVIGLATDAHELASPAHAQPLDLPLREDLPGRFFTMETP
ncbi:hypothetical protein Pres01_54290 [Metapseudomonas resinovorans]|nr:hypothetical protein Pres01_54290 [Pseudomonas resinovorans]